MDNNWKYNLSPGDIVVLSNHETYITYGYNISKKLIALIHCNHNIPNKIVNGSIEPEIVYLSPEELKTVLK
jgi:hypothetical protein